jgi:hypothetical protein
MIKEDRCLNLEKLRNEYDKFKDKYSLPEFTKLNEMFDIEEVDYDTEFLLRKIRRVMSDRISGYLRFIELVLNPSNAPMFFFKLIKKLEEKDKNTLNELYEFLSKFEIEIIAFDLEYNEKNEADFIKKSHNIFKEDISKRLLKIIKKMSNGSESEKVEEKRSYFG